MAQRVIITTVLFLLLRRKLEKKIGFQKLTIKCMNTLQISFVIYSKHLVAISGHTIRLGVEICV